MLTSNSEEAGVLLSVQETSAEEKVMFEKTSADGAKQEGVSSIKKSSTRRSL